MASDGSASPPTLLRQLSVLVEAKVVRESQPLPFSEGEQTNLLKRKTKIIATLGPATKDFDTICKLLQAGMNIARINLSHGTRESHAELIKNVREASACTGIRCAILADIKGPKLRTGLLKHSPVMLQRAQILDIIVKPEPNAKGDEKAIIIDCPDLVNVLKPSHAIKIDDGLIELAVQSVHPEEGRIRTTVKTPAPLHQRKGVNIPGVQLEMPDLSQEDIDDIKFLVKEQVDFIGASFVRRAAAIEAIRNVLGEEGKNIKIIAKIETQQALSKFDEILEAADGIMVARGDLGAEIPLPRVVTAQKTMIRKCNLAGKPVITATQMLESMVAAPRPTRAEATDVANAVFDGTDCVMLSAETARGEYPVEAVMTMSRICFTAENALDYNAVFNSMVSSIKKPMSRVEAITSAAVKTSIDLDAGMILVLTETGNTARLVAKYKPAVPIMALTPNEQSARQCLISRALFPILHDINLTQDEIRIRAMEQAKAFGWLREGQEAVIVAGIFPGVAGTTNMLKLYQCKTPQD